MKKLDREDQKELKKMGPKGFVKNEKADTKMAKAAATKKGGKKK